MESKISLFLSLALAALIIISSSVALLTPDFYAAETANWRAQSTWQDLINLFLIVPAIFITSFLAYRKNKTASMILGGIMLYVIYSFVLYSFDVHFNELFLIYCCCLGISFYSFIYFLFRNYAKHAIYFPKSKLINKIIGIYFIIVATNFYYLWLTDIIPSIIENSIPKSVIEVGLLTNGVHVIDLAVILPAIFITGVFLLKKKRLGFILTPVILTFFILMDVTIGFLVVIMKNNGVEGNLTLTGIMSVFALLSLTLLILYFKNMKQKFNFNGDFA